MYIKCLQFAPFINQYSLKINPKLFIASAVSVAWPCIVHLPFFPVTISKHSHLVVFIITTESILYSICHPQAACFSNFDNYLQGHIALQSRRPKKHLPCCENFVFLFTTFQSVNYDHYYCNISM